MIDRTLLLKQIDENFEIRHQQEIKYKAYVSSMLEWWEENLISKEGTGFLGQKVKFKEADCMCTRFDFAPCALIFSITFRPMQSNKDIGSGAGNAHDIKFQ